jgi:hypothetical protein
VIKEIFMRWPVILCMVPLLLLGWSPIGAADGAPGSDTKPRAGITVWDSGRPSTEGLTPAASAGKNNWTAIPLEKTVDSFQGDAVLSNGRITAVLRQQDPAMEVYAAKPDSKGARLRLRLRTTNGDPAVRLDRVALIENSKGSACLEASFRTASGATVAGKFRIKRGDISIQVEPGNGAGRLNVECPGRFLILPDFFADDITIDATRLLPSAVELPSENFVLHLAGNGDAIALCVFENRQQDVKITLAGEGAHRRVTGSEIGFEGKKIWVGLLEAPGIWHTRDLKPADTSKTIPLGWKMPFPAQWRVDFTRSDDLTDSWEMLLQEQGEATYTKPSWLGSGDQTLDANRRRWNTVLGWYPYPCWSDAEGHGYLQPLKSKVLQFQGAAIVYPIHRVQQTPLDAYTVVDVMRNTLGVGPCEHILDLEGQKAEYKGRATCSVRDTLTPIYANHQQQQKRAEIDRNLDEGLTFVQHIRSRITRYVEFGQKMRQYLAEQKKEHPELAEPIAEMERLTQEIDKRVAARAAKIQTPQHVARMNEEFRKNVLDYDGPDALARCRAYTRALVEIGDNQDELSGECRWAVRALRQRAGIRMALEPRLADIALEIRARTQEVLRSPADHEGARH